MMALLLLSQRLLLGHRLLAAEVMALLLLSQRPLLGRLLLAAVMMALLLLSQYPLQGHRLLAAVMTAQLPITQATGKPVRPALGGIRHTLSGTGPSSGLPSTSASEGSRLFRCTRQRRSFASTDVLLCAGERCSPALILSSMSANSQAGGR